MRFLTWMTFDTSLPSTAAATATAREAAKVAAALRARGRPRRAGQHHAGHDFLVGLHLTGQELGVRPVSEARPEVHRLELFVDEDPHAAEVLNRRQRRKQRIDRLRRLRRIGLGCARRLRGALAGRRDGLLERRRVDAALLHPRDELRLFVGRHRLDPLEHPRLTVGIVEPAAALTTASAAAKSAPASETAPAAALAKA